MSRTWRVAGVVGAVVLAWAALWLARPSDSQPHVVATPVPKPTASFSAPVLGKPPVVTGGIAICPFEAPYSAYKTLGHHFYPPNHPLHPSSDVLPDRCFATADEARLAGFVLAQAQQFSQVVDGIYLIPADIGRPCATAASRLGFPVPCPYLLPNPGPGVADPGCGQSQFGNRGCVYGGMAFLFEQPGFAVPPGYGVGPGGFGPESDLVIAAYPTGGPSPIGEPFDDARILLACPNATPLDEVPTIALPMVVDDPQFLECSGFYPPIGGTEILRWRTGRVTYEVAILGLTETNRRIAEVIVANLGLAA